VCFCNPVLATASTDVEELKQIRKELEAIPETNPQFKFAIEELLKINYRSSDWPSFFSYAQYYRKHFKENELSDVQLLEALALLRHCQDEPLAAILAHLRSKKKFLSELDQIEALSKTHFQGKKSSSQSLRPLSAHVEGKSLWKTDHKKVGKFHPSLMKIKVENLCS
jgi:hypothetical protein